MQLNIRCLNEESLVAGQKITAVLEITAGGNLVDANITVEGTEGIVGEFEGSPTVTFEELEPGEIVIKASKEGYEDGELTIQVPEPEEPPEPELPEEPPEEPPEDEPPEIPEPDETPESSTPICDNIFFGGQIGLAKTQETLNAIKAEIWDLEISTDPIAEDKVVAGRKAIALLEAHLQEEADKAAEIAAAKEKADEADENAKKALEEAEKANNALQNVLAAVKARKGGVYFV